jgi:hypothetical protein
VAWLLIIPTGGLLFACAFFAYYSLLSPLCTLSIVGYIVSFGLVDSVPWHALLEFTLF